MCILLSNWKLNSIIIESLKIWFFSEKQFMDLRDLEWRYFKGLAKWKHTTMVSIVEIKYNSEKRFVESPDMPGRLSPPLVHRSMFIYPQKEGNYDLKWNI